MDTNVALALAIVAVAVVWVVTSRLRLSRIRNKRDRCPRCGRSIPRGDHCPACESTGNEPSA